MSRHAAAAEPSDSAVTYTLLLTANTGRVVRRIDQVQSRATTALAASRDDSLFASATDTGPLSERPDLATRKSAALRSRDTLRVWNVAYGRPIEQLPARRRVRAIAFSPDRNPCSNRSPTHPAGLSLTCGTPAPRSWLRISSRRRTTMTSSRPPCAPTGRAPLPSALKLPRRIAAASAAERLTSMPRRSHASKPGLEAPKRLRWGRMRRSLREGSPRHGRRSLCARRARHEAERPS